MIPFLDLQKINAKYAEELRNSAHRVIDSGWYLKGNEQGKFEQEYADYIGTRYCVTCGNGLDALTIMLRAYMQLGVLNGGDEIILPANTFLATVLSVTENKLTPVFVEPRIDTLQIDDQLIEAALTSRTRAVLLVHLYGICAYTDRVGELCRKRNLLLLEDNAQAHGMSFSSSVAGRKVMTGSLGDAAAHSFYPGKNLGALGDAGALTTNDKELADAFCELCNYGFSKKYYADYQGRNSRMDELQAAFLSVKLKYLDQDNAHRAMIANYYSTHIANPLVKLVDVKSVFHVFTIFCKYRNELQLYLTSLGIETLIHYPVPPHKQKCYPKYNSLHLPITEKLSDEELSLPISPVMTIEDAEQVVRAVNSFRI